jgi:hypothetical protein
MDVNSRTSAFYRRIWLQNPDVLIFILKPDIQFGKSQHMAPKLGINSLINDGIRIFQ